MYQENLETMKQLDRMGLKFGDMIELNPLSGRCSEFKLNRTQYDFVCEKNFESLDSLTKKKVGTMNKEAFHVRLKEVETKDIQSRKNKRFIIESLSGGLIRLNGNLVQSAFVERGDVCEIGYNTLKFETFRDKEITTTQSLIHNNRSLIKSHLPILIEGETGVGKTRLAKKVHEKSGVKGRFVHINLSSFSENLIESELFGHEKGAFTGANQAKQGAFREANYGTLFIDEVDSLPLELQTKLLLFFDDYTARAVGGDKSYKVKTRLIFASGQSLLELVEKKRMRKDFYFRLTSGETFHLKSLREDPALIKSFCLEFAIENELLLSNSLVEFYQTLPWAGNFRQLKSHLELKKVLSKSHKIGFDENDEKLIVQSSQLTDISEYYLSLHELKVMYAKKIFYQCKKNYTHAARKLKISPKSLKSLLS